MMQSAHIAKERIDRLVDIFQECYGLVVAVARRYAPASDLTEDIIHQAYLDFIQGGLKGKWDLTGNLEALLYQITKRAAQVCWREQRRNSGCYADRLRQHLLDACKTRKENDDTAFEECEMEISALYRCMEKLPFKSRDLIEQHYFEGKKIKDIGREQKVKDISSLYHYFIRIRQKLRKCMESSMRNSLSADDPDRKPIQSPRYFPKDS